MKENFDLTKGSVWDTLFKFFIPVAAGGIVQQLYNTVDGLIVGQYCGTASFAAITGSVNQILNLMVGSLIALSGGAAVYIAQLFGISDKEKIKKAISTSMHICMIIGVLISYFGYIYTEKLLRLMNTPEDTMEDAVCYLKWCFAVAFAVMIYNMGSSIIRASGDSKTPFVYLCICCFTNIVLDYVLVKIYGLGVYGAAVATAFSQLVSAVLVVIKMLRTNNDFKFFVSYKYLSLSAIVATLKYGIPSGLQQLLYGITNVVIQVEINKLGTSLVAAWSLTSKLDGIYWAIINAAGVAVMNFVGQNYGAGRLDRVKEAEKTSMKNFMIFTAGIFVFLAGFGKMILPWFVDDLFAIDTAYKCILIFSSSYVFWTVIEIMSGLLKGCGDVIVPSILVLVGIVGIRLLWVYTIYAKYTNIYVLSLAYTASWLVTAVILFVRYKAGGWKKKRVL